jgi:3-oxoacyl-[acyl-carrier protein] reductase
MSKLMNDKKVIVITGTRKGIGRYLAEYYLAKGLYVYGCSRSETDLESGDYHHYCLDVADEIAVKKMINGIYREAGKIDYLINNAGIASMNHSLLTPLSIVESIFRTNVFGTFLFCREAAKIMIKRKTGRIINFTTVAVPLNLEGESVYSASKAAIEQLTKTMAKEFGENGITVNAIGPSPIKTDLIRNVSEDKLEKLLKQQAIHKYGEYRDVTNITDFYLSEASNMVTGQIIYLSGVF